MTDPHEGRGYDFELHHDLFRGTQTLSKEDAEQVEKARSGLLYTLGILTATSPPEEMTAGDVELLQKWLSSALMFRNAIRACFDDIKVPEETVH